MASNRFIYRPVMAERGIRFKEKIQIGRGPACLLTAARLPTRIFVLAKWLTSDPVLCQTLATRQAYAMYQHSLNRLTAQPFGQLFFLVNAGKLEAGL